MNTAGIDHDDNDDKGIYKEAFMGMAVHTGLRVYNAGAICTGGIDNGISCLLCYDGVCAVRLFHGVSLEGEYCINQRH
jgi:hypothetical protein